MKVLVGLILAATYVTAQVAPLFDPFYRGVIPHTFPLSHSVPVVKPDGFLADTPEVAAAKTRHFAELELAKGRTFTPVAPIVHPVSPLAPIDYRYISPVVHSHVPVVTRDGFLADTPEVAAEKARHFAEVAKAKSRIGHPFFF